MRSWLSVLITDAKSKKGSDIPIAPSLYSLSNKMGNSLLAVRDINHKYIVVEKMIVENGITYVLGEDDIYYPDLQLPEGTNYNIGKFGHMRCEYLKEFKHGYYMELLLSGKLNEYLHEVDEECHKMLDQLVEQMKEKQGVTEQLKAENQMLWVGRMNNIIACAEEIVVREVVLA